MRRARSAAGLLAAGTACLLATAVPASPVSAADEPGSGLGSFAMAASAPAVQAKIQEPNFCFGSAAAKSGCELVLPEVVSTLRNGPLGAATAAVVWPGALAADIGSLLITASDGQIPPDAKMLNDPVRAEAQTSTGPDTVVYDQVPGTHMKAVAKDDQTSAEASVESSQATPLGSFGKTQGASSSKLTGPKLATVTAHSSVQDISLAAGVVHIDSVVSDAIATSDGVAAKASGKTVASGITVQGIPVTVDDRGITVATTTLPSAVATATVNTALNAAGIIIAMGAPIGKPTGGAVTYSAGSLVVLWKTPGATFTVALGGVNVSIDADPALDFSTPGFPTPTGTGTTVTPGGTTLPGSGTPPLDGGTAVPPTLSGGSAPPVTPTVSSPDVAPAALALPKGLSPWLGVTGVLGAGLVMFGLKRLPDRLLEAQAADCLIEETA